jgi:hypothetical protein
MSVASATITNSNQTKGKQMARNGKAINVKIATTKVIKALETKLGKTK